MSGGKGAQAVSVAPSQVDTVEDDGGAARQECGGDLVHRVGRCGAGWQAVAQAERIGGEDDERVARRQNLRDGRLARAR